MLTTHLAGRAIGVKTVDLVIDYDLRQDHREFVDRVGRCCRGGNIGTAISLVTQHDVKRVKAIEAGIDESVATIEIDEEDTLKG